MTAQPTDETPATAGRANTGSSRRIVVLSAPSGAGKTTLAHRLLERNPGWRFSVSATTRPRRPGEVDGVDYHFLTIDEFRERIAHHDLVEWEEIFGNFYGTLKSEIEGMLGNSSDRRVIFDIDVRGALAIRTAFPKDAFLIFVAPPSMEELTRRLMGRQTESEESLHRRIDRAQMEMAMQSDFDAIVVNDEIERATDELEQLLRQ
jgi:guanylate kinase